MKKSLTFRNDNEIAVQYHLLWKDCYSEQFLLGKGRMISLCESLKDCMHLFIHSYSNSKVK